MITLLVLLVVIGVVLYGVSLLPIDAAVMNVIRAVVVLFIVLVVLDFFGLLHTGVYRWR